jgi:hypothetical protein
MTTNPTASVMLIQVNRNLKKVCRLPIVLKEDPRIFSSGTSSIKNDISFVTKLR